jgi:hypothetical protein
MILYLSSQRNSGLFYYLEEHHRTLSVLQGKFDMLDFLKCDYSRRNEKVLIIDYEAIKAENDEDRIEKLIKVVETFRIAFSSQTLIVYLDNDVEFDLKKEIYQELVELNFYNIITASDLETIQTEGLMCINEGHLSVQYHKGAKHLVALASDDEEEELEEETISSHQLYDKKFQQTGVIIGVYGTQSRIGTTSVVFNMANVLKEMGALVACKETDAKQHFKMIFDACPGAIQKEDCTHYLGIDYFSKDENDIEIEKYNFLIVDLSVVSENNLVVLDEDKVNVVVGGVKPYEIEDTKKAKKLFKDNDLPVNLLLANNHGQNRNVIIHQLADNHADISNFDNIDNLFDDENNKDVYQNILKDYITKVVN